MTVQEFDLIKDKTYFASPEAELGIMDFIKPKVIKFNLCKKLLRRY